MRPLRFSGVILGCCLAISGRAADVAGLAAHILQTAGIKGGLIVHVGCGDGTLTAALRMNDSFLVHGLETDAKNIAAARAHIRSLGLHGRVSVEPWAGQRLPYVDHLANLLVVSDEAKVTQAELLRVLAPNGVAVFANRESPIVNRKLVKPWPQAMDEWTHHLHDAGGNAVARDTVVGPPQHLQWTAGPLWSRSHGWTPSVSAMVSARGRLFYLCDETLTGVDGTVPDKWQLTARDAFSGVLLWKRPVQPWGSPALSGTPGTGAGSTTGRFTLPPNIGKRLVAVGDTVYVTLGAKAPVTALDAATGAERRIYAGTERTDEMLFADGRLIATLNPPDTPAFPVIDKNNPPVPTPGKRVCALEADTGKVLWNKGPFTAVRATRTQDPFGRLELVAGGGRVFLLAHDTLEALAADTGESVWRIDRPALPDKADRRLGFAGVYEFLLTVLVYHDNTVLLAQPEPNSPHTYHTMPGTLYAFDARDGRLRWQHAYGAWGHCTQPDVFVVNGLVWTHEHVPASFNVAPNGWIKVPNTAAVDYRIQGLDLVTGQMRRELPTKELFDVGHHHRCYRNKITERFLMASRRGVEFVDLASGENWQNHWVRSGCLLGNLPCNGLLYVAPHSCSCYLEAKLTGFNALAPTRRTDVMREASSGERLERGPAFGEIVHRPSPIATPQDWPTYRHDGQRSGATEMRVSTHLDVLWTVRVGQRLSGLTIADGRVCVADVDGHTVHALSASDGKPAWQFTADGRVDSPPTLHEGLAIFGSSDGHVRALRAADGALVWQFRAAPDDQRLFAHGQLESPWPVPGSVLVKDGQCWFAAGRSSYLDGGIRFFVLDPVTGRVARQQMRYDPDPNTGKMKPLTDPHQMPGLLNDIPATDGTGVFIRQLNIAADERAAGRRVFSTAGYLDPSWFNRTYWKCGPAQTSGLMVLGRDVVFGMELYSSRSRETVFTPGANAYRLVCRSLKPGAADSAKRPKRAPAKGAESQPVWEQRVSTRVTAMLRAGDTVFAAGSPDVCDPADPHAAWEGRKGGLLAAFAAADGKQLAGLKLPAPPVWDGMAVAGGRLYVATEDGQVLCLAERK